MWITVFMIAWTALAIGWFVWMEVQRGKKKPDQEQSDKGK